MKMKLVIALLVATALTLAVVGLSFAGEAKPVKGVVTEVTKDAVTVRDEAGKETTVEVKDAGEVDIGDEVVIEDGKVTKLHLRKPPPSRD
ncbi:MAG: hypothetical protein ABSA46_19405 [Thermodesulfovibrionales bacterium]|jgi:hypothetical protein